MLPSRLVRFIGASIHHNNACITRAIIVPPSTASPSLTFKQHSYRLLSASSSPSSSAPPTPSTAVSSTSTEEKITNTSSTTKKDSSSGHRSHKSSSYSGRESFWATLSIIFACSTGYLAWRQSSTQSGDEIKTVKLPAPKKSGVVHESEAPWIGMTDFNLPNTPNDMFSLSNTKDGQGAEFQFRKRPLGYVAAGQKIGTSLFEVAPGKTAFPYHYHTANEEAIYILDGMGVIRIGEHRYPVHRGSYIALPVGPAHAHQLWNTSDSETLRYLCYSTMTFPEITVYPDSGKIGAQDGPSQLYQWFYSRDSVPFFAGEGGQTVQNMTPTVTTTTPAAATAPTPTINTSSSSSTSSHPTDNKPTKKSSE